LSLPASSPTSDNIQSHLMGTPPMEGYPGGTSTTRPGWFNEACRLLRASPLFLLILEELPPTGFAPASSSTPYGPWERWPVNEYPTAPPPEEASHMFMEPLSHLMHPRSAALHTPSWVEAPASFSFQYPTVQPSVTAATFVHSQNPHPITGVPPIA